MKNDKTKNVSSVVLVFLNCFFVFYFPAEYIQGGAPVINVITSFTKDRNPKTNEFTVTVPAIFGHRSLKRPLRPGIDLSLSRGLTKLQKGDGSFVMSKELVITLGLMSIGECLGEWKNENLLTCWIVGLTIDRFDESDQCFVIRSRLDKFLRAAPNAPPVQDPPEDVREFKEFFIPYFSELQVEALIKNFRESMRGSKTGVFPAILRTAGRNIKEFDMVCPRFFLVDLASSFRSLYEVNESYSVYVYNNVIFIGKTAISKDRGPTDPLRQGYTFEYSLVNNFELGEDCLLTEATFPSMRCLYQSNPDACHVTEDTKIGHDADAEEISTMYTINHDPNLDLGFEPLSEFEIVHRPSEKTQPSSMYSELKKTTHLHGENGKFKKFKFRLQLYLVGAKSVVVGLTDGKGDKEKIKKFDYVLPVDDYHTDNLWKQMDGKLSDIKKELQGKNGRHFVLSLRKGKKTSSGFGQVTVAVLPARDAEQNLDLQQAAQACFNFEQV